MKKLWNCGFAACLALFMSSGVFAQDYEFSITGGPESYLGTAGSTHSADYTVNLGHMGEAPAAQGWSLGVEVVGGTADALTMAETDAEMFFSNPLLFLDVIDPERNDGKQGFTVAVVLTSGGDAAAILPANAVSSILTISTTFTIPAGGGAGSIGVVDGLRGPGAVVPIVITEPGAAEPPFTVVDAEIALIEEVSCCDAQYNVGFSLESLNNSTPGEGILNDSDLCNGVASIDASGETTVFADFASNTEVGIQGWSVSIEVSGDIDFTGVSKDDTSGSAAIFHNTQIVEAEKNPGRRGIASAVVFCFDGCGATLNLVGTESILQMTVDKLDPAAETASGDIFFKDGLIGGGQPVMNVLTVAGGGGDPCDTPFSDNAARLTVNIAPVPGFNVLPGDSNNDSQVNIADPVYTINNVIRDGLAFSCELAADANGDRMVDLADAMYTINYEFLGGPAPVDGLECTLIEADDAGDLTCDDSACPE